MKEKMKWNDYDALPLILDVTDIQHIMGISRASAYQLLHMDSFPTLRIGKRMLVPKEKLMLWIDQHTGGDVIGS